MDNETPVQTTGMPAADKTMSLNQRRALINQKKAEHAKLNADTPDYDRPPTEGVGMRTLSKYEKAFYTFAASTFYKSPQTIRIELQQLVDSEQNSRLVYRQADIDKRKASIAEQGQLSPILVAVNPDDPERFIIIDGHTRVRAIAALAVEQPDIEAYRTVVAVVRCVSGPDDIYALSFLSNAERDNGTAIEQALTMSREMSLKRFKTQAALAKAVNMPEDLVSRYVRVGDLFASHVADPEKLADITARITYSYFQHILDVEAKAGGKKAAEYIDAIVFNKLGYVAAVKAKADFLPAAGKEDKRKAVTDHVMVNEKSRAVLVRSPARRGRSNVKVELKVNDDEYQLLRDFIDRLVNGQD